MTRVAALLLVVLFMAGATSARASEDIAATVYTKLGIPVDLIAQARDGRPVRLIEGKPIKEWI